ncbi:MAG: hypothetical protein M3R30_06340 [Candidatus Eremiobacteraeota bacterium]|nr:hypothetical protein [Candidatus Eremiobacteraeota bacterium]
MLTDDLGDVREGFVRLQDGLAERCVLLHRTILVRGQSTRLDQDLIRDQQLADVVQEARLQQPRELRGVQVEIVLGPMLGHRVDAEEMHARERIAIEQTPDDRLDSVENSVRAIRIDVVFADRHASEFAREPRTVQAGAIASLRSVASSGTNA